MSGDGPLDRVRLETLAREQTDLDDMGDLPYVEPLDVLIDALERDARVTGAIRATAADAVLARLRKRLELVADRVRYPEIADETVFAPVFIVGLPRTGSTHLHGLLGEVSGARTPRFWEMTLPSPPPEAATAGNDARIDAVQQLLSGASPELMARHPMDALRPEQCNMLYDWSFLDQTLLATYDIPSYRHHLYDADYAPAYEAHRRTLQHLQWRHPGRWVLKYPKHLFTLDRLLDTYPDARFVWTHRDPAVVIPSACSLTGLMRSGGMPGYDPLRHGPEWTTLEELSLRRGLEVRDRLVDPAAVLDLHYAELMADPEAAVAAVCDHAGIAFDHDSRAAVRTFGERHPRNAHGVHRYTAADFGLDADRLRRRFAF
ncbi:MAG: sulfotransferase, partial [Acidimicrobiales bacterium]|nr:sulfotransferase [Acidimicrobiales bacterium]